MECGFGLPIRGRAATLQNRRLLARHVEALGLDCVCGMSRLVCDIMTTDVAEMQRAMERLARDVRTGVRA